MKINNNDIQIKNVKSEYFDDTTLLSLNDSGQIIILNSTASFIWNFICEHQSTSNNINTSDIVCEIEKRYKISEIDTTSLYDDVNKILNKFIDSGLIHS